MHYFAVVGSRKYPNKARVETLVKSFADEYGTQNITIVSGGARGVDTWAVAEAEKLGMKTIVIRPDLKGCKHRGDMVNRYYERNKKIVEKADKVFAFVIKERKGGTENTLDWCKKLGVTYEIVDAG